MKPQTVGQYRQVWAKHGAGQLGALRVAELPTSRANAHIQAVAAATPSQAGYLRIILRGMFSMAIRFDVLAVNPIIETKTAKVRRKPARAMTPAEFERVRGRSRLTRTVRVTAAPSRAGCCRRSSTCSPPPARGRVKCWPSDGPMWICWRIRPRSLSRGDPD